MENNYNDNNIFNAANNTTFQQTSNGSFESCGCNEPIEPNMKKPGKTHPFAKRVGILVLSGAIFGTTAGAAAYGVSYFTGDHTKAPVTTTLTSSNTASTPSTVQATKVSTSSNSVKSIASQCMPSIVAITNKGVTETMSLWGQVYQQESQSAGSGVIIGQNETELLVVTNYHVVKGSKTLSVVFSCDEDNEKAQAAQAYIKGYDSNKDLAVIGIKTSDLSDEIKKNISIAAVGKSTDLSLGEQVVAIGNALGYGQSVTAGFVSALNRTIAGTASDGTTDVNKYIQTDAAINPGNSGGALFNMNGELVGINTAKIKSSEVEGMGYAIPISDVYDLIQELMNSTTRTDVVKASKRGYLGISGTDVTPDAASAYGFPEGIYVSSVKEGSAAEKAGIQKGNIITKFDGKTVSSLSDLQQLLTYYSAGESVKMTVKVANGSEYTEKEITIKLSTAKEAGITASTDEQQEQGNQQQAQQGSGSYTFPFNFGNGEDDGFSEFFAH